ncbi:hypothetical protein MIR68_001155 [Amoeboaphelidium protococcarum]|nr:hypothetical protein MIR68_001155 [Amoeboaphelidium protococcarum]
MMFSMKLPPSTDELLKSDSSSSVCEKKIRCKVAPQPFAFGSLRLAYHARLIQPDSGDKQVVMKQFKHVGSGENVIKRYVEDLECQTVAAHFAKQFKRVYPPSPIAFAKTKVMKFYTFKTEQVSVEPYMPGEYKKWSNNSGIWIKDDDGSLMAAFSHWTFVESRGQILVCDLQGVKNSH